MKQIIQSYRSGELWLAETPEPAVKAGGVVVRTGASLVSAGTERMIVGLAKKSLLGKARARPDLVKQVFDKVKTDGFAPTMTKVFAKLDTPITLGYSCAGTVAEVGRGVTGLRTGDRVACGGAGYAAHAEYNFVPKNLCAKIPDGVSDTDASFATVGAIAMQGVRQADPKLGERVAVIGLGLLGLLTVQLLKASGCAVIGIDIDPSKCALAKELGADAAASSVPAAAVEAFTEGRGADVVLIAAATSSNGPIETAAEVCRMKGKVVIVGLVGMDVPRDPFYKKELDLRLSMSYGPGRYDPQYEEGGVDYPFAYVRWTEQRNMESFLYLIAEGKVTPSKLVTHTYPIDNALRAYELLEGKTAAADGKPEPYLGIVIDYPGAAEPSQELPRRVDLCAPSSGSGALGVGFLGAGAFAQSVLLPALKKSEGVAFVGVCTATGMNAEGTAKKHGFSYATTDYTKLLADDSVHAVFIATRHNSHAKFVCDALAAGKHVFVEKPLAITPEGLAQVQGAVAAAGDKCPCIMVGFNRRFSPHASAIREAFSSRSTPMALSYRVNAGVVPPDVWLQDPEVGGGRIVGEVCHFLDFAESLIGSPAVRVYADCVSAGNAQHTDEDTTVLTLGYEDGSVSTVQYFAHGAAGLPKERVEVFADGMVATLDNFRTTTFHGMKRSQVKGAQAKGFAEEIAAFLTAAKDGGAWPIPWQSLDRTTRAAFGALDSLRTGQVVPLA